jgi:large subunit ribosomal protein L4
MYRAAMRSVLSELVRQDRLVIVKKLKLETPKTKELLGVFKDLGLEQNVLIILDSYKTKVCLAARNLPWVDVLDLREVNPVSLIRYDKVLATTDAIKGLEEHFA